MNKIYKSNRWTKIELKEHRNRQIIIIDNYVCNI